VALLPAFVGEALTDVLLDMGISVIWHDESGWNIRVPSDVRSLI
jgi:hypothetical protein